MNQLFQIKNWAPSYSSSTFFKDLIAGLTVGVMLIPQGMAYAFIAGLPPEIGLYTAIFPQLFYAIFGSSKKLAMGPVALDALIISAGLAGLGMGAESPVWVVAYITLMVGCIQMVLGFFRAGFLVNFLSSPVLSGFISGGAVIIALSQLNHLLGIEGANQSQLIPVLKNLFNQLGDIHIPTLGIGIFSIGLLLVLKRLNKKTPGPLLIVFLGIALMYFIEEYFSGVETLSGIPEGLPEFSLHKFDWGLTRALIPVALTLAFIGLVQSYSLAKKIEENEKGTGLNANNELIAMGTANFFGSWFGTFTGTGGLSRSAVAVESGARTPFFGVISSLVIVITLLFLTPLFEYLPKVVLGAIIIVAVYSLIDIKTPIKLYKHRKDEFLVLLITFLSTLFLGVIEGVVTGVILSLGLLVYRTATPHIAELGRIKGTHYFKNVDRFANSVEEFPNILIIRFDSQIYFGNQVYFKKAVNEMIENKGNNLEWLILNAEAITYIDYSASAMLKAYIIELKERNINLIIAGAIGPTRDILHSSGLYELIGKEHIFVEIEGAVKYIQEGKNIGVIQHKIASQTKEDTNTKT